MCGGRSGGEYTKHNYILHKYMHGHVHTYVIVFRVLPIQSRVEVSIKAALPMLNKQKNTPTCRF